MVLECTLELHREIHSHSTCFCWQERRNKVQLGPVSLETTDTARKRCNTTMKMTLTVCVCTTTYILDTVYCDYIVNLCRVCSCMLRDAGCFTEVGMCLCVYKHTLKMLSLEGEITLRGRPCSVFWGSWMRFNHVTTNRQNINTNNTTA